ncbi:keratinocyte proline-rich protein-like [Indicator indicator]|uniref:keratinocyte proline-rich protein-like n=1 Tax=Indicator indicator TaxID=1002788 RepID=UPI0023DF0802|nr:keratinocyte proline-rich protein-like [Indicator indicator]
MVCGEQGWAQPASKGCCYQSPTDLPPCHDHGSLSRDLEGSCQSEPQACQSPEPCPARSCCSPQQSCSAGKPRRRVEVSHAQPACPPPAKIHRRPLQQYRPPVPCPEPGSAQPRRRVEQCPLEDAAPCPLPAPRPRPLQHRCPCSSCIPCCLPPSQRCGPCALPPQHQLKQVTLVPPCPQRK